MPTASVAPKVGAPSQKQPPKVASSAPKVPSAGSKTPAAPATPKAASSKYLLPEITHSQVVRLFENIPEYSQYKIVDLDILIKGMMHLATQPIAGVGPGGLAVQATPLNNFVAQLVMLAVERGSKGVARNG